MTATTATPTTGQIIKVQRGRIAKRAYVLATFEAAGITWVEFAYVTHTAAGSIVIGRKRHYEQATKVVVA